MRKPKAIIEKLNLKPNTLGPKDWWLYYIERNMIV